MQTQNVTIRAYEPATDTEKLSGIWLDASLRAHGFIGEDRLLQQRALIETEYLPNAQTWVACLNEEPVGFISLIDTFVGGIFVAPDRQGHGIGRRLIAKAIGEKRTLSLEVYTANHQAMQFYTVLGFEEVSRRPIDDEGQPFENALLRLSD
ncbi:GNAT family N-acetyltransferase [Pelagibacterium sp.]|uniref:GNAT family N-acetyltransferase n=1 Tax=Pelagibacterium sp. TaxID=1967288 RepID=UPI003A8F6E50